MTAIKLETKKFADLSVPTALGGSLTKFKDVKIPAGFFPTGYEFAESFTLEHIADIIIDKLGLILSDCGDG